MLVNGSRPDPRCLPRVPLAPQRHLLPHNRGKSWVFDTNIPEEIHVGTKRDIPELSDSVFSNVCQQKTKKHTIQSPSLHQLSVADVTHVPKECKCEVTIDGSQN